ncbi:MAG TPA: dehydrogenase E1 component subunit alpha/beta [Acidimicrobiales bacterium]|nr:dehydrogenase E1 component subunit alpha/beta [Acidimicrobiales bacterium]
MTTAVSPEDGRRAAHGPPACYRGVPVRELLEDFRLACLSRALDDRQLTLHKQGRAFFHIAGAGHEALYLGIARSLRPSYDWFFPYYRDLALVLALGITPKDVLLHAVGSADDLDSAGRQMPSHWGRPELHIVSQSSPTGSQCLAAVGCAEAGAYLARRRPAGLEAPADEVTYVSLGEGATSEGEFWESLNTACRLRLPVCYVVPDNGYAISVPVRDQAPAPISELVAGFPGLRVARIDGCDYFASRRAGAELVARARAGGGPALIHASVTRPYSHSSSDNQAKYRPPEDLAGEARRDPLRRMEDELTVAGVLAPGQADEIRREVHALVAAAAAQALEARRPLPSSVTEHLVALPRIADPPAPPEEGERVFFGEAIQRTLHELMALDERVRVFGEDVADASDEALEAVPGLGGVFGTTLGLQRRFGEDRCYNTPLAEANIVGRAIGQALRGLRPFPEIQFFDYIWPAMHQLRSEAATMRWRSAGRFSVPMVLRCAIGGYVQGGAIYHSQCGESIFTHIPGLIVLFPSRARDAAGLLRAAWRCEDPVLFLEHKHLYRQRHAMDPFPPPDYVVPLGRADLVRAGRDLTIVTWGATVQRSLLAAQRVAEAGVEVEILDLRSLAPWDREAVATSLERTGRLLVVHEDVLTSGFGAEVAAFAADECFAYLDAPVRRCAAKDVWVGYEPNLLGATLPQVSDIAQAALELAAY